MMCIVPIANPERTASVVSLFFQCKKITILILKIKLKLLSHYTTVVKSNKEGILMLNKIPFWLYINKKV